MVCWGFPPSWNPSIIHPIYKPLDNFDPNNYKTIMFGHTFDKSYDAIFDMFLLERLERGDFRARAHLGHLHLKLKPSETPTKIQDPQTPKCYR
jgi:hypothetical protein